MVATESRKDPAPFSPEAEISVVIPAFNEARRIKKTIGEVVSYLTPRFQQFEVIVVDDGSVDGTGDLVCQIAHPAVRCLKNSPNQGKGFSVRRGVLESRFDPVMFTDADLSAPISELERLLEPFQRGFDLVIASRRTSGSQVRRSLLRKLLGWGFSRLVGLLAVSGFRDTQCGFKLFRRAAALKIFPLQTIERWGFDVEILTIAVCHGLRVAEIPVQWAQSDESGIRAGTPLQMAGELLRIRRNLRRGLYRP